MAKTFSLTSNSYDGRSMTLSCTQVPNASNNTSTINWTLTVSGGNSNYYSTGPTTVTINGTQVYYKDRTSYTSQTFPAAKGSTSGSLTVSHNTNGSKSIAVSLSTAIYTSTVSTKSGTWTLDTLGRASTASITSAYIGDYTTCTISAANSSYTHKVYFTCLGQTTTVGTSLAGGSHRFMIPDSYYNVFGDRESATATGTCETYSGGSLVGSANFTFTINALTGSDAAPILDVEAYDTDSTTLNLTGNATTIIPGYSNVYYSISATAQNGASISSYRATIGSSSKTTRTGTFTNAASGTITLSATDSRGNTARETIVLDTIDYIPLTCNLRSSNLSTGGSMTITVSGNCFNGSFGDLNNTLTVYYRYKQAGGTFGSWTTMSASTSGDTYTATKSITGLNPEVDYVFEGRAVDRLSDITSSESNVQNKPVFDWSGTDFNFNVPVHFSAGATGLEGSNTGGTTEGGTIEGDVNITGDLTLKGSGNYGNTIYFGDGSYAYIQEDVDDELLLRADAVKLDGKEVFLNSGLLEGGYWTPRLNASAISSYATQEGWYQVVGDTAVVGFLVTATANSGYHTTPIEILGFPFKTEFRSCGGGTAYNAYTSAGFSFNAWWMDEQGLITGRMVPSNNTTAGNQSITTNCCYPSGGGSLTLSGTICCKISR